MRVQRPLGKRPAGRKAPRSGGRVALGDVVSDERVDEEIEFEEAARHDTCSAQKARHLGRVLGIAPGSLVRAGRNVPEKAGSRLATVLESAGRCLCHNVTRYLGAVLARERGASGQTGRALAPPSRRHTPRRRWVYSARKPGRRVECLETRQGSERPRRDMTLRPGASSGDTYNTVTRYNRREHMRQQGISVAEMWRECGGSQDGFQRLTPGSSKNLFKSFV